MKTIASANRPPTAFSAPGTGLRLRSGSAGRGGGTGAGFSAGSGPGCGGFATGTSALIGRSSNATGGNARRFPVPNSVPLFLFPRIGG